MGIDITLFLEKVSPDGMVYCYANGPLGITRDYEFFDAIKPSYGEEKPLYKLRGLPKPLSDGVFHYFYYRVIPNDEIDDYVGWEGILESRLRPEDLKSIVSFEYFQVSGMRSKIGYFPRGDQYHTSYLWKDELLQAINHHELELHVRPDVHILLELMDSIEKYYPETKTRIVFWFDG